MLVRGICELEASTRVTIVITTCTNRKRRQVPDDLRISALEPTGLADLATQWVERLGSVSERHLATDLYGGRGFREAQKAAESLSASLLIVSAGLGLIRGATSVPAYSCTVIAGMPDSIEPRIEGSFSVAEWWSALAHRSPFHVAFDDILDGDDGLILTALSDGYIEMFASDLLALPLLVRSRLRVFTRAPIRRVPADLVPFVMPYDERLDGPDSPIPGTLSDFAGRAVRHFVDYILSVDVHCSAETHRAKVAETLTSWRTPAKFDRVRLDDASILDLLRAHAGVSLGRLRGEFKVACEQGRYARLARIVREEKK